LNLASLFLEAAAAAGKVLLRHWGAACDTRHKADGSPLSSADLAADHVVREALAARAPWRVVSEESCGTAMPMIGGRTLLVDPLDGTREFLAGRPDFAVSIGLVDDGRPVAGCLLAPALGLAWTADGEAIEWRLNQEMAPIAMRPITVTPPEDGNRLTAVISLSHSDAATRQLATSVGATGFTLRGSALKFVAVADGEAGLYPRLGRTMAWDTAGGHALVEAAGGTVLAVDGGAFRYPDDALVTGNGPFVAAASLDVAKRALAHWPR
jgi:3'(2'), 5'-bisphosphate nucleotidase